MAQRAPAVVSGLSSVGSHLAPFRRVGFQEVLDCFTARTSVSSGFGSMLERARDGLGGGQGDPMVTQAKEESARLRAAGADRCIVALHGYTSIRWTYCPTIRKLAKNACLRDGAAVCDVLRAYQPWDLSWPKHGFVAVYEWARTLDPSLALLPTTEGKSSAQLFREGKAVKAERLAVSLVADAQLVLREWVERWNRRLTAVPDAGNE